MLSFVFFYYLNCLCISRQCLTPPNLFYPVQSLPELIINKEISVPPARQAFRPVQASYASKTASYFEMYWSLSILPV